MAAGNNRQRLREKNESVNVMREQENRERSRRFKGDDPLDGTDVVERGGARGEGEV